MKRLVVFILAFSVSMILVSCARIVKTHKVLTGTAGEPIAGEVKILKQDGLQPVHFEEVAILQATIAKSWDFWVEPVEPVDIESLIEALRLEAAEIGCNIVVLVRMDEGVRTASVIGVAGRASE